MLSRELDFLGRTYNPRIIIYNSDGGGRDTYIQTNNGGFYHGGIKQQYNPESFELSKTNTFQTYRYIL